MQILEDQPLAPYTTFAIGGPARWFVEATSEADVVEAVAWAAQRDVPLFVLGGGSNLLVADTGFQGLVLKIALRGITAENAKDDSGQKIYRAAAGESWEDCVERTLIDNCAGLECLAGIPGTVGGTPVQNVGAYGMEVASSIQTVRTYDRKQLRFVEFPAAECDFSYRHSRFNSSDKNRYIVTRVDYRLTPGGKATIRYADLQKALEESRVDGATLTLPEIAAVVRRVRQSKGMMMVEGDADCRSAGSFFKNPVVAEEATARIAQICGKEVPHYAAGPGQVKLPAAWLIEQAGFPKGYTLGAAGISTRHTLALTNRGNATAAEVLALAAQIRATVQVRFGISLEMEPVLLGFSE